MVTETRQTWANPRLRQARRTGNRATSQANETEQQGSQPSQRTHQNNQDQTKNRPGQTPQGVKKRNGTPSKQAEPRQTPKGSETTTHRQRNEHPGTPPTARPEGPRRRRLPAPAATANRRPNPLRLPPDPSRRPPRRLQPGGLADLAELSDDLCVLSISDLHIV